MRARSSFRDFAAHPSGMNRLTGWYLAALDRLEPWLEQLDDLLMLVHAVLALSGVE